MPNYPTALHWFERASAVGDIRIDKDAQKAVQELTELLTIADERNNAIIDKYRTMSTNPDL
jgi:hypothetical protein